MAFVAGVVCYSVVPESAGEPAQRMAGIFAVALVLWVTEAVPLFATSLFVIVAEVWLLALPTGGDEDIAYEDILTSLGNPIIFLFLGGFILARGLARQGIDVQLAAVLMRPFGQRPSGILAGLMIITALLSMWMSNTATTALMIALIQPMVSRIPSDSPFRTGVVLSIPLAANVGGIGTPIGTPPNAIAMLEMSNRGQPVDFLDWMVVTVPLLVIVLAAMWFMLVVMFPAREKRLGLEMKADFGLTRGRVLTYICFWVTVLLWLSTPLHGIPTAVIAVVPAAFLPLVGIIGRNDFNSLEWDVLILIAGGIALATGLRLTGLDTWLIGLARLDSMAPFMLLAVSTGLVVAMSIVVSNTVATNIVLPLAVTAAITLTGPLELQVVALMVAIGASFAMALPVSTPPNAITYGSGMISSRDLMRVGSIATVLGATLVILIGPWIIPILLGILGN